MSVVKDFGLLGNFLKTELIGLSVEIIGSNDKDLVGVRGVVVDESKNMLELEVKTGVFKKVFKGGAIFLFRKEDNFFEINGKDLIASPWDRVKKKWKKRRW